MLPPPDLGGYIVLVHHICRLTRKDKRYIKSRLNLFNVCTACKVLTQSMIAEHAWDIDFYAESNVIGAYVTYLRKNRQW